MAALGAAYPRDVVGYGAAIPHAQWPGAARIAVQFVINYEVCPCADCATPMACCRYSPCRSYESLFRRSSQEGGENCILHGDAASENLLSEIVGAQPYSGARHMNMESLYDYGQFITVYPSS